jgi:aryl-alcohol dehydrogenase-like predicted oxidoreductase
MTTTAAAAGSWMLGDLAVNRMGFGAMRLAGAQSGVPGDRAQAISVLRRAVELGVNHIDTAAFYFSPSRSANELINSALAPYPGDLVITTKVWPGRDPSGEWYWAEPGQLRGQVEENLRQLGRDHLDVVNLRIPRSAEGASIAEHFAALAALRAAGLIRHLGISGISAQQLAEARAIAPVVCVQNRYGLEASAADHTLLDLCGTQGIAFVPFFAIAGPAASRAAPPRPMRPFRRSPEHTMPRRLRSGWPGPCTAARTCSPSPYHRHLCRVQSRPVGEPGAAGCRPERRPRAAPRTLRGLQPRGSARARI